MRQSQTHGYRLKVENAHERGFRCRWHVAEALHSTVLLPRDGNATVGAAAIRVGGRKRVGLFFAEANVLSKHESASDIAALARLSTELPRAVDDVLRAQR